MINDRGRSATSLAAGMVVLVVDDEQPIAALVSAVVTEAGHTPVLAYHGREALDRVHEQWPGMVITDLMMPLMDGGTLIAAVRREATETGRKVPTMVVMTAASRNFAQSIGADATLQKPFDLAELETLLDQLTPE